MNGLLPYMKDRFFPVRESYLYSNPRKKAAGTRTVPGGSNKQNRAYVLSCIRAVTLKQLFPEDAYLQQ